jgi:hypothetical protein
VMVPVGVPGEMVPLKQSGQVPVDIVRTSDREGPGELGLQMPQIANRGFGEI